MAKLNHQKENHLLTLHQTTLKLGIYLQNLLL